MRLCNRLQTVTELPGAGKENVTGMSYRYDGRRPMSTIYEVAKRAGVSTATVSRVLSQPDLVTPDTRRKVMQAVEFLDYAPNSAAKNLRTLRTGKLLVTVPDISNPFFSLILQGIEDAAQREGYAVLLGDTQHDEEREDRYALMLKRKEADGLIVLGHRLPKEAAALVRAMAPRCAPVVNGCEFTRGSGFPACTSTTPRRPPRRWTTSIASATATSASITGPLVSPLSRDRLRGATARARAAEARARLRRDERRFFDRVGRRRRPSDCSGVSVPPTAMFCFNDEMAMGVVETAQAPRPPRPARRLDRRLRRHPLRALHRSAADHGGAADARDRRRHGGAAARDPGERRQGAPSRSPCPTR